MKRILFSITIIFLVSSQNLFAQVRFDEVGLGLGYWLRSYKGDSEYALLVNGAAANNQNVAVILPTAHARLALGSVFGLQGKLGLAQESFTSSLVLGDLVRREVLKQTLIPANLMLDIKLPLVKTSSNSEDNDGEESEENTKTTYPVELIAGVGLTRYFIQHDFERIVINGEGSLAPTRFSGNDFGINAMLGVKSKLTDKLVLTLYGQYNSGQYNHRVYSEEVLGDYSVKEIALRGVEFGVSIGYVLK